MDQQLNRLIAAVEEAHTATAELQIARANDPRCTPLHRHLWIVRHSLNAARAAMLDVGAEASRLRDLGVEI